MSEFCAPARKDAAISGSYPEYREIDWGSSPPDSCLASEVDPDWNADGIRDECDPPLIPEPDAGFLALLALLTVGIIAAIRPGARRVEEEANRPGCGASAE